MIKVRRGYYDINNEELKIKCIHCGKLQIIKDIKLSDIKRWEYGELIQNVFPDMDMMDRESMITSFCHDCIEIIYKEME